MFIERYSADRAQQWDALVEASRNGTFLFMRPYMDYHSDRFVDHSLMAYDAKHKLMAVLPACEVMEADSEGRPQRVLCSHQGLTYGGFVMSRKLHAADVLALFGLVIDYLRPLGFTAWRYKPVPTIYHRLPSQDDTYALWRHHAQLTVCNLSCSLQLDADADVQVSADASRRHRRRLAEESGLRLHVGGHDLPAEEVLRRFWPIMEDNMMQRYGARPVHTLDEMLLLQRRFPRQVLCYLVTAPVGEERVDVAGEVLFVSAQVAHAQYGHASAFGRQLGALDFLYLSLIDRFAAPGSTVRYFDFGTSNEDGGRYLNESLIAQKEGFGGRGVAYCTYTIAID